MKKIINGKAYNTETGTLLATYEYGYGMDFRKVLEELYVTKKGAYFLYYFGGPSSKYGESIGNNQMSESSGIKLLSKDEAKEFMEENGDADDYEKYFGEVEEG
ncbi:MULTISPECIES: hypothetical protein [Vagococcus]|uniref:Uncharacterized protein n=1 Tax=Vagococcus fluvialis bH819 TaxID=1255619 RepID=A0A1X6WQ22_9ENTE|nr:MULTISPECIES: hypothetical protein [Vagococcus]SLM86358.1 hypothetical protein FM121_09725 [Vagococcus fluvialis bH819]HCM89013.1 hypothetical protein [Vagococcus sp.]